LLRRAYDHHRDLRTRVPAAVVAHPVDRVRQLMTITPLSPSPIIASVRRHYLTGTGTGHAPPPAAVSAAFGRQNLAHRITNHRADRTQGGQNRHSAGHSTVVPVRNRQIRSSTGVSRRARRFGPPASGGDGSGAGVGMTLPWRPNSLLGPRSESSTSRSASTTSGISRLAARWSGIRPSTGNTKPNFSESFYITRDRAPDHSDILGNKPLVGLNRSPSDMPEFRAATTAYYAAMERMTTRLVPIVAMALDLSADYFAEAFAEPNCTIRLIHYPTHPNPEENEFGFAPHTDNNFLTFLAQSRLPGLEVLTAEGDWIRPPAPLLSR
jgi:hypothetical protein